MSDHHVQDNDDDSIKVDYSVTTANYQSDLGVSVPGGNSSSDKYEMNNVNRGKLILIVNEITDACVDVNKRKKADVGASNIKEVYEKLGFKVERYDNKRAIEMLSIMEQAGVEDHTNNDCFAVMVLTRGVIGKQGFVYGINDIITTENLVEPIKKCLSLAGKPKLFFFQACVDSQQDNGGMLQKDADPEAPREDMARIPQEADFLITYSTATGSQFVQALVTVLGDSVNRDLNKDLDFLRIMTRVNKIVNTNDNKEIVSVVSRLTKDLYLHPRR